MAAMSTCTRYEMSTCTRYEMSICTRYEMSTCTRYEMSTCTRYETHTALHNVLLATIQGVGDATKPTQPCNSIASWVCTLTAAGRSHQSRGTGAGGPEDPK